MEGEIWINYYGDHLKDFLEKCIDYLKIKKCVDNITVEATNFLDYSHIITKEQFVKDAETIFVDINKKDYIWLYSEAERDIFLFGFKCGLRMGVLSKK